MAFVITLIGFAMNLLTIVVIIDVFLSYFMSPYQPVRQALDAVVNPLLMPIRRLLPAAGPLDFSPFILIILIQVVGSLLINLLRSIA